MAKTRLMMGMGGAVLAAFCIGCPGPHGDRLPVYPVTGKLLVKGQPAVGAKVRLHAQGSLQLTPLAPHAVVEADGSFRITTFNTGDGAPIGTYALTVTWPLPPRPGRENDNTDRLQGRYATAKQPARMLEVVARDNDLETIDLK